MQTLYSTHQEGKTFYFPDSQGWQGQETGESERLGEEHEEARTAFLGFSALKVHIFPHLPPAAETNASLGQSPHIMGR